MRVHACDCFQAAVGHLELIGKDTVFTSWANASILLGSHPTHGKVCRPIRQPCAAAYCLPNGPLRANCLSITVHEKGPCRELPFLATTTSAAILSPKIVEIEVGYSYIISLYPSKTPYKRTEP